MGVAIGMCLHRPLLMDLTNFYEDLDPTVSGAPTHDPNGTLGVN